MNFTITPEFFEAVGVVYGVLGTIAAGLVLWGVAWAVVKVRG